MKYTITLDPAAEGHTGRLVTCTRRAMLPTAKDLEMRMTNVKEIETAVAGLPMRELARFREWFLRYDAELWDQKIEQAATSGRLDALAERASRDFRAGRCQEL